MAIQSVWTWPLKFSLAKKQGDTRGKFFKNFFWFVWHAITNKYEWCVTLIWNLVSSMALAKKTFSGT
jgi:hypothetical protein